LKLGAKVVVCGPPTLVPPGIAALGVEVTHRLEDILPRCAVINVLRIQFERQRSGLFPSIREYVRLYRIDAARLAECNPNVLLLAPGPINRGVEKHGHRSLACESGHLTLLDMETLRTECKAIDWKPVGDWVESLRAIKDDSELAAIRGAIHFAERAFEAFRSLLRPDDQEKDLSD